MTMELCAECFYSGVMGNEEPCCYCKHAAPLSSIERTTRPSCWKEKDSGLTPDPKADAVNHPAHYETGKFECIDVMIETQGKESVEEYCLCAAFKYLYRHKRKNGIEDIKKARWYLDKYLEMKDG